MALALCMINTGLFAETPDTTRYDKRIHHYRQNWGSLIPTQLILQTCGNMGLFSVGVGWDYGKRGQWETQLLFGYIPKYSSHSAKMTITLKENYIPWSINLKKGWSFEPLECGLYFNTVIGQDFWTKQPTKYQSGYYPFPPVFARTYLSESVFPRKFLRISVSSSKVFRFSMNWAPMTFTSCAYIAMEERRNSGMSSDCRWVSRPSCSDIPIFIG